METLRLLTRCDDTDLRVAVLTVEVDPRAPYKGTVTCSACHKTWTTQQVAVMRRTMVHVRATCRVCGDPVPDHSSICDPCEDAEVAALALDGE